MGLEWGGFILMISHYGGVAILGYIEIHYPAARACASTSISQTNKQNKTARETRKERKKEKETKPGRAKNVIIKGALK